MDHLAKKVKLEPLDPREQQGRLVLWERQDLWVLLVCLVREDALDLAASQESAVCLVISGNLDHWVRWG